MIAALVCNTEKHYKMIAALVCNTEKHYKMIAALVCNTEKRGGIRYQVPDITLVGGSFFLPKTQLVHGTNWWVYCPFSKKTVSTWY